MRSGTELTWSFLPRIPPIYNFSFLVFARGRLGRKAGLSGQEGFFVFVTSQRSLSCDLTADLQNPQKRRITFVNEPKGIALSCAVTVTGLKADLPCEPKGTCPVSADIPP